MARDTVVIGCRLPHGITLEHPTDKECAKVRIKGLNSAPRTPSGEMVLIPYATTEVDADFWAVWKSAYLDYVPLKTGALFEARNESEAKAVAKELLKEKTGFEPMEKDSHGIKTVKGE